MTTPPPAPYRDGCGTKAGLISHGEAREALCALCRQYEGYLELERELVPTRPTPPGPLPLTREQVARNRQLLQQSATPVRRPAGARRLHSVPARRDVA